MAGRYPDYDWRGIAMLTQQLGQLFEPSKARLMSQQQDHEMNMLMAKQAWDMQSEQLDALKLEYKGLTADLETQTNAVNELGLRDLANAGRSDGANVDQSAEIYDKLDVKNLSDMQEVAAKYREMIRDTQGGLDNMRLYNEEAKIGQAWRKGSMTKKDRKGVMVDYYEDSDKDGIAELSYEEGQNAIKKFITDNYTVAEGEQGMEMDFGTEGKPDIIMVKPEAIAFRAGWESGTGTGTGRGKAEKGEISDKQAIKNTQNQLLGGKTFLKMTDQELITSAKNNKQVFDDIDKNSDYEHPLGLVLEMVDGEFVGTLAAKSAGFEQDDVIMYSAAYTNYRKATQEMLKRGIEIPDIVNNGQADPSILQDFSTYGTHPDSLMSQIAMSDKADKDDIVNYYNEFLRGLPTMKPIDRRKYIKTFQDWLVAK